MNVLGMTCRCGRSVSVPCPTVGDIPEAATRLEGWGRDDKGHIQCPQCRAGDPAPREVAIPSLFDYAGIEAPKAEAA